MLKNLIAQLLDDLDMESDELHEEAGRFSLDLDDDITITFINLNPTGISIYGIISDCPDKKLEDLFTKLMIGNLFGEQSGGAVIGLNTDSTKFTLRLDLPQQLTYKEFYGHTESFLNHIDYWRGEVEQHIKKASQTTPGGLY